MQIGAGTLIEELLHMLPVLVCRAGALDPFELHLAESQLRRDDQNTCITTTKAYAVLPNCYHPLSSVNNQTKARQFLAFALFICMPSLRGYTTFSILVVNSHHSMQLDNAMLAISGIAAPCKSQHGMQAVKEITYSVIARH